VSDKLSRVYIQNIEDLVKEGREGRKPALLLRGERREMRV
jgi:hypothetical protein